MTIKAERQIRSPSLTIRAACAADAAMLADLHSRAYAHRFFDPAARGPDGNLYGAPLAREFPVLARGQNRAWFEYYWQGFAASLDDPDPRRRTYCYIAERQRAETGGPTAFVKGDGAPVSADPDFASLFNRAAGVPPALCGELGSVYCDPAQKYRGAGRALVAVFAACVQRLGYQGMVTRAYDKNDSPAFFEKLGARLMGPCAIANDYLADDGTVATLDIPGVWLYWDRPALADLAAAAALPARC